MADTLLITLDAEWLWCWQPDDDDDDDEEPEASESLWYGTQPICHSGFFNLVDALCVKFRLQLNPIDKWLSGFDVIILKDQKILDLVSRWPNTRNHLNEQYHAYTLKSEQLEVENGLLQYGVW